MFQVYTIKNGSDLSKTMIKETKDFEEAYDSAEKAIENKPEFEYIIEETDGHFNSYGDQLVTVVAKSSDKDN